MNQAASVAENMYYNEVTNLFQFMYINILYIRIQFVNFMKTADGIPVSLAQGQILNNKEENPQTLSDSWLDDFQKSKEEQGGLFILESCLQFYF